jgi:hypothetical protein
MQSQKDILKRFAVSVASVIIVVFKTNAGYQQIKIADHPVDHWPLNLKVDTNKDIKRHYCDTDWFSAAAYGAFISYTTSGNVDNGRINIDTWNRYVNSFDVNAFAQQCQDSGVGYVLFMLGQNSGFYCSPNATLETYGGVPIGSRCSSRDLPMDLYNALAAKNIQLMLYLPSDCANGDTAVATNFGLSISQRKGDYIINPTVMSKWANVVRTWSIRYGGKVKGWWFDGYYPSDGITNNVYAQQLRNAVHDGNPHAIMTFNAGWSDGYYCESTNWTYVVLTYDGTNWNFYANGQAAVSRADAIGALNWNQVWAIGNGTGGGAGRLFHGNICQVAIYNYALTPTQVEAHYAAGTLLPYEKTVLADRPLGYWPLNLSSDTNTDTNGHYVAKDLSGNGNNGTFVNIVPSRNNASGPSSYIQNAASFNGVNAYVNLGTGTNAAILNFGGKITLEAWVQPSGSQPNAAADIIAKGYDSNANDNEVEMRVQGNEFYGGTYSNIAGNQGARGGRLVPDADAIPYEDYTAGEDYYNPLLFSVMPSRWIGNEQGHIIFALEYNNGWGDDTAPDWYANAYLASVLRQNKAVGGVVTMDVSVDWTGAMDPALYDQLTNVQTVVNGEDTGAFNNPIQPYKIFVENNTNYLIGSASSPANGGAVQSSLDSNNGFQQWRLVYVGGGYYEIAARNNPLFCLAVSGTPSAGSVIHVSDFDGDPLQLWRLVDVGGGFYEISLHENSACCLELSGTPANGTSIQVEHYSGNKLQQFKIVPAPQIDQP